MHRSCCGATLPDMHYFECPLRIPMPEPECIEDEMYDHEIHREMMFEMDRR